MSISPKYGLPTRSARPLASYGRFLGKNNVPLPISTQRKSAPYIEKNRVSPISKIVGVLDSPSHGDKKTAEVRLRIFSGSSCRAAPKSRADSSPASERHGLAKRAPKARASPIHFARGFDAPSPASRCSKLVRYALLRGWSARARKLTLVCHRRMSCGRERGSPNGQIDEESNFSTFCVS